MFNHHRCQTATNRSGIAIPDGQPEVEAIENLSVAIVINQKRIGGNARSTVGTITDIYSSIGLGYLNLNRNTTSLSGGESQRIKMVHLRSM